jgi:ABC-2 type transport system permease protein
MRDFWALLRLYFTQFRNKLLNPTKESLIKSGLILAFAAFFFPVVYQLFYFMFKHFYSAPVIGPLLVNRLISAFFMTFSIMVVLSAIVSAIPVLYFSRDMDFLFSSPVKIESIFTAQSAKIISGASWMVVLMGVPIFAAYAMVLKIGLAQYFFILASIIPFCVCLACAGIILTLFLVRYFPAENVRNIALAFMGIFAAVMIAYFRMLQPEKLTGAGFDQVSVFLQGLKTPDSVFLPHTHLVNIVKKVTAGGILQGLGPFLYYAAAGLGMLALTVFTASRLYFEGYGRKGARKKEKPLPKSYVYVKRGAFASQLIKDFKYLLRDTSQWIQVVFLCGLVFIYLFNLYKLPSELYGLRDFIYFLNIAFIGLIMSAIGARFVLPVISNEGRSFWMYKTAPVTMKQYVLRKAFVYGIPLVFTGLVVALVSVKVLKSNAFVNYLTFFSIICVTAVIAAVGTGFGAYFADFNIKNPEELVTGAAGLAYMFVSFIFTALVLFLESGVIKAYYMSRLVKAYTFIPADYWTNFALVGIIAAVVSVSALWAGVAKLEKLEI